MTERPDHLTQPIAADTTAEQSPMDAAAPAPDAVPSPTGPGGAPVPAVAAARPTRTWRSRVSTGRGLAVAALVVGLGLGAVGGSAVTFAATHDDGTGAAADGVGGFDRDGDLGPPGRHDGPPPGGRMPGGDRQQGGDGGTTGQSPGGRPGSDGNSTSPAT